MIIIDDIQDLVFGETLNFSSKIATAELREQLNRTINYYCIQCNIKTSNQLGQISEPRKTSVGLDSCITCTFRQIFKSTSRKSLNGSKWRIVRSFSRQFSFPIAIMQYLV